MKFKDWFKRALPQEEVTVPNEEKFARMTRKTMEDVGTRLEHLDDLRQIWQTGIDILERRSWKTPIEYELIEDLKTCVLYLGKHMTKDFNYTEYSNGINAIGNDASRVDEQ